MRETRAPIVYNTRAEQSAAGIGVVPGTDHAHAVVFVPIFSGDRLTGQLAAREPRARARVRRIRSAAAADGGVEHGRGAGERAPLRRDAALLKETEQRNAELAVINSIQQGMAGSLDFQGIVDLVGDKLREVFEDRRHRHRAGSTTRPALFHYIYEYEHGQAPRHRADAAGRSRRADARRAAVVYHTAAEQIAAGNAAHGRARTRAKSYVSVQIIGSDRVLGRIQLENHEREHAFGEAEVRLLQTVASSMGVALENARLFDETQRLLKETEQRAAEMAVINSIQQGIAGELSFQAIVDLVGDKLREVLKSDDIGIALAWTRRRA